MSLVLLPDVALWRFPNRDGREGYERIIGRPRNVFRRLWWRCQALGAEEDGPGGRLLEDEAVAIMERPTLGGDRRVALAIASEHLRRVDAGLASARTEIMRQAMKRLRRLSSVTMLGALDDGSLEGVIREVFSGAVDAVAL
jgi:hypothetical protein